MEIRDAMNIIRGLSNNLAPLNESGSGINDYVSHDNTITEEELEEEIRKFTENVMFAPKETFGKFVKNENNIMWEGKIDGKINWYFYVNNNRSDSKCTIEIYDEMEVTEGTIETLNSLYIYFDNFYEFWFKQL